jgi:hypothetical protein
MQTYVVGIKGELHAICYVHCPLDGTRRQDPPRTWPNSGQLVEVKLPRVLLLQEMRSSILRKGRMQHEIDGASSLRIWTSFCDKGFRGAKQMLCVSLCQACLALTMRYLADFKECNARVVVVWLGLTAKLLSDGPNLRR